MFTFPQSDPIIKKEKCKKKNQLHKFEEKKEVTRPNPYIFTNF